MFRLLLKHYRGQVEQINQTPDSLSSIVIQTN